MLPRRRTYGNRRSRRRPSAPYEPPLMNRISMAAFLDMICVSVSVSRIDRVSTMIHTSLKLPSRSATYEGAEGLPDTVPALPMTREYLTLDDPADANASAGIVIADEVILASSQEHPGLFGLLIDRYQAPFLRCAERVVRNRSEAEDVVQDAFIKIYRYASKFRQGEDRKFSSWAYKIVLNTAITHYHRLRRRELPIPEEVDPTAELAHDGFRKATLDRETAEVVRSVLEVMPADLRDLLRAYYLEAQAYQTIADREGMTIGALKMKLFRARKVFKKMLAS